MKKLVRKTRAFLKRHVATVAFVSGFVWDSLTLTRIDLVYENVVFISYLVIALCAILLIHCIETHVWEPKVAVKYKVWLPAFVQFPLGGLFSGFVIFYTKSAAFFTAWPFLVLLFTLLVGNEFLRRRYERLTFQIGIYFLALMLYLVLVTPMVLGTVGTISFVLAGLMALVVMSLVLQLIMWLFPQLYKRSMKAIWLVIGGIYIGFNVMYVTNVIPPVPLALKDIGIYHAVVRDGVGYNVRYEPAPWWQPWRDTSATYSRAPNEAAYCFASVFAPTDLNATIYHHWERLGSHGAWVKSERIPYTITGGRDEGFRGYTIKTALQDGDWRCVIKTDKGKVIGETRFTIRSVEIPVSLEHATL